MKCIILIMLGMLLIPNSGKAIHYFISQSLGNDSWSGRLAEPNASQTDGPKRSLNAMNQLLNTNLKPGDSLFMRRGDKWIGTQGIIANACQGTPAINIFVGAYGVGNKPLIEKSGAGEILLCRASASAAASYLHFKDIALVSKSPVGSRPNGVIINEAFYTLRPHHIRLDGLYITGCQNGMILYQKNIVVENCLLEKNGNQNQGQGIFCSANEVEFKNNVLDSNGCGSVFVHSMYISQCSNILIENNEIRNADDGLKLRACTNLIVRNNNIHHTYIHTIHAGGDDRSGTSNIIIEGNYIHNAPQGLRIGSESGTQTALSEQIIVRNNIFPAQVSITNNGPVKDLYFFNNLIHTGANQPALFFSDATNPINLQIKNNIFFKNTSQNMSQNLIWLNNNLSGIQLDHNLYYYPVANTNIIRDRNTAYSSLPTFRNNYPSHEVHGQQGNPNLSSPPSEFKLTSQSLLAIDKGADISSFISTDFEGKMRPVDGDGVGGAAMDIGPYEYCCLTSSDEEMNVLNTDNIFPNPAKFEINVHCRKSGTAMLCNHFGKKVAELFLQMGWNKIEISHLLPGVYFIYPSNVNSMEIGCFIKE